MHISHVQLSSFRNYNSIRLSLPSGISIFAGNNGQGKTNLLEAVYLCCTGRSHRTTKDRDMIKFQSPAAYVEVEAKKNDGTHIIQISVSSEKQKRIKVNGSQIDRIGKLMGHIEGVLFSPEDLRLVKEGPSERRRFADIMLSQMKPAYFYALQAYNRALAQRNHLLKLISNGNTRMRAMLPEFTQQLADKGAVILKYRHEFLNMLKPLVTENHEHLSGGAETLSIRYVSQINAEEPDLHERITAVLEAKQEDDTRRGTTSFGPHRDDIQLMLNGRDMRAFGSQGQQRTAALSLKLAELGLMRQITGEWPVLMLDDVMSELDTKRKNLLLDRISGVQTLITCTGIGDISAPGAVVYNVSNGEISPE